MLAKADVVIRRISGNIAASCAVVFFALIFMTCSDVFLRFGFNKPLPAAVEIGEIVLPWIAFLGLAYALVRGAHVRLTLVTDRLSPKAQLRLDIFVSIVGLVLFTAVTYLGWLKFWESFVIREVMLAAIPVPWWVGKMAFPIGTFFISLQLLSTLLLHSWNSSSAGYARSGGSHRGGSGSSWCNWLHTLGRPRFGNRNADLSLILCSSKVDLCCGTFVRFYGLAVS